MLKFFSRVALAGALAASAISAVAVLPTVASAQSNDRYNRHVMVINNTSRTMVQFYASNTGTNSWQEDILGQGTLAAGAQVDINIDDGTGYCRYDFRAVFEDGTEDIIPRVNVCEVPSVTYTD